jgi:hypothetical protein
MTLPVHGCRAGQVVASVLCIIVIGILLIKRGAGYRKKQPETGFINGNSK